MYFFRGSEAYLAAIGILIAWFGWESNLFLQLKLESLTIHMPIIGTEIGPIAVLFDSFQSTIISS